MADPYYTDSAIRLFVGDAREVLRSLPDESVQCCVTSPPYWGLRDYGVDGQLGLESTPEEYVAGMVEVFREVRRVLRDDGTLWLNIGDSYASSPPGNTTKGVSGASTLHGVNGASGRYRETLAAGVQTKRNTVVGSLKPKDLVGIPWRVAFALQADGWYLRSEIIWHKPNPMPESVRDRPTKAHEQVFLLSKAERYWYDADAIAEPFADERMGNPGNYKPDYSVGAGRNDVGTKNRAWNEDGARSTRNRRTVWTITTKPYPEAHFATFPPELPETCIKAGCPKGGVVLDPFAGAGTTLWMAKELGRQAIGVELNPTYADLIVKRVPQEVLAL